MKEKVNNSMSWDIEKKDDTKGIKLPDVDEGMVIYTYMEALNDDEEESGIPDELKSIFESIGKDKKLDGTKIVTIDFSDMPKDAKEYLHNALMKLVDLSKEIKELKKGKK